MYNKKIQYVSMLILSLSLTGCAFLKPKPVVVVQSTTQETQLTLSDMIKNVQVNDQTTGIETTQFAPHGHHKTLVNYVEQMALDLADTLDLQNSSADNPLNIGVTSLVTLDSTLNNSNQLGNQISETLIHQLQKFGYSVVDFKTMDVIDVNARGDFAFTRDMTKLNDDNMANYVLAGTLIYRRDGVAVNTRIINVKTKQIVASSRKLIPYYVISKEDIYLSNN